MLYYVYRPAGPVLGPVEPSAPAEGLLLDTKELPNVEACCVFHSFLIHLLYDILHENFINSPVPLFRSILLSRLGQASSNSIIYFELEGIGISLDSSGNTPIKTVPTYYLW